MAHNKALQHRYGFASTGQFVSCAFVVLLRKSIPQRPTYKLSLNLALCILRENREYIHYLA